MSLMYSEPAEGSNQCGLWKVGARLSEMYCSGGLLDAWREDCGGWVAEKIDRRRMKSIKELRSMAVHSLCYQKSARGKCVRMRTAKVDEENELN